MPTGKLKKFFQDKGFGFIVPDQGGEDLFAHKREFSGQDADSIQGNEKVTYEQAWDDQKGKYKAGSWSIIGGGSGGGGAWSSGGGGAFQATGKVKKFFADKGFAFIAPDAGGDDLFAHQRQFQGDNVNSVQEGESVGFDIEWDDKKGKNKAGRWGRQVAGGGGGGMPQGQMGYGVPQQQMGMPRQQMGYGVPQQQMGMPQQQMGMPQQQMGYGMPQQQMGMPQQQMGMPQQQMGMPQQQMGMPQQQMGCGMPQQQTGMAQGGYGPMGGQGTDPRSSPYGGGPAPQQGPGGPAPLPAGWEQVQDPASGKTYYCNRSTGETSWTPPAAPAAQQPQMQQMQQPPAQMQPPPSGPAALPQGWEQAQDPSSGKTYYFNRASGQTSWEIPA